MSDSESIQEVPLGFLQEGNGDNDAKIVAMLEEKKPSLKQRMEQVTSFKSRVLDLLAMSINKISTPGDVLIYMPDLIHYCTSQPDNSSQAHPTFFCQTNFIIKKFLNDRQDVLFLDSLVEQHSEEYSSLIDQLFISIFKSDIFRVGSWCFRSKRVKTAHNILNPILKKLLLIKHDTVEQKVRENFKKLLQFSMTKKEASYLELFISPILNYRPTYLELFATELTDFLKVKSDGGPKTDLHRLRALQIISKMVQRLLQSKKPEEVQSLHVYLKSTSKEIKKVLLTVAENHEEFKVKKNGVLKKYLELVRLLLRAYRTTGLGKRFNSLKEAFTSCKGQFPEDNLISSYIKKIEEEEMGETAEEAAD